MNPSASIEISVGAFIALGLLSLAYLALNLGELDLGDDQSMPLSARFTSSSGLREGAHVEVGGVRVGSVRKISLDPKTYEALVEMRIRRTVRLQVDSIASIRTSGIVGDKFVKIAPGGATEFIAPGGEVLETEASINLEELLSKYIFSTDSHHH